jgi:hypothetical protein
MNSDDEYTVKEEDEKKIGRHSKEYMRNYMKDYLDKKNKDNICEYCGGKYKTFNKAIHEKTDRHKKGITTYEKRKEDENIQKQKFTEEMYLNLLSEVKSLKELFLNNKL